MTFPWTLQVNEADHDTREVVVQDGLTIGRHPECALVLKDSHVSARHARLTSRGEGFAIIDLGSNNGTHIDSTDVLREGEEKTLRDGMKIAIGRVEIVVRGSLDSNAVTMLGDVTTPAGLDSAATMMSPKPADDSGTMPAIEEDSGTSHPVDIEPKPSPKPPEPPTAPAAPAAPTPPSHPPAPAQQGSGSSFSAFDSVALNTILGEADNDVGASVKLASMGARLIVLNEADMRAVDVDCKEFTVGRKADINCNLQNRGVSSEHARIVFNPQSNTFFLEDLGSANGTQLDGAPLALNAPRELHPDAHIRFGTIEAVFLQAMDSGLRPIPTGRHAFAAKLLTKSSQLSTGALKQAKKEAAEKGISLGEALLLGRHVVPRDWARSVEDARVAAIGRARERDVDPKRVLLWVLIGLLLTGAALMATPAGRELLGFGS